MVESALPCVPCVSARSGTAPGEWVAQGVDREVGGGGRSPEMGLHPRRVHGSSCGWGARHGASATHPPLWAVLEAGAPTSPPSGWVTAQRPRHPAPSSGWATAAPRRRLCGHLRWQRRGAGRGSRGWYCGRGRGRGVGARGQAAWLRGRRRDTGEKIQTAPPPLPGDAAGEDGGGPAWGGGGAPDSPRPRAHHPTPTRCRRRRRFLDQHPTLGGETRGGSRGEGGEEKRPAASVAAEAGPPLAGTAVGPARGGPAPVRPSAPSVPPPHPPGRTGAAREVPVAGPREWGGWGCGCGEKGVAAAAGGRACGMRADKLTNRPRPPPTSPRATGRPCARARSRSSTATHVPTRTRQVDLRSAGTAGIGVGGRARRPGRVWWGGGAAHRRPHVNLWPGPCAGPVQMGGCAADEGGCPPPRGDRKTREGLKWTAGGGRRQPPHW